MDEQELDKQLKEMEGDKQVRAAAAGTPPAPHVKKRTTVADLKKQIEELEQDINGTVFETISALAARLDKLEEGSLSDRADVAADITARLENQDATINALVDALRSHIKESEATPPPAESEIEFAQPPQQMAGATVDLSGMMQWPNSCQTMNDVLLVCRALKESPEITDKDKIRILDTACKAAGVIITPGLQIRAGVKFTGA